MKTAKTGKILYALMALVLQAMLFAGVASAKSLYAISDINANPTPIQAYDIQPDGSIAFQAQYFIPRLGGGAVGIAIDEKVGAETLFITYEVSNTIQLIDAQTMTPLGTTTAPGATNLSGIVVDQQKQRVYTVDRNTPDLYVYDLDTTVTPPTLTLVGGAKIVLPSAVRLYGLALDEINDVLYVSDNTSPGWVRGYETVTWTQVDSFSPTDPPSGIAVDALRGFVYTVAPDGFCSTSVSVLNPVLSKYNLNTASFEADLPLGQGGFGLGADPVSGYVYMSGGCNTDNLTVWDTSAAAQVGPPIALTGSDPTGLVVPLGDVSYNPLNLSKTDNVDPVQNGNNLTYTICYDNTINQFDVTQTLITDDVPAGTTFVSATGGGTLAAGTVTWDIGTVQAGAVQACVQMTVNVAAPPETTSLVNSATISGLVGNEIPVQTTQTETTLVGITLEELFQGLGEGELCANLIPVGGPHAAWALAIVPLMLLGIWLARRPGKHGGRLFLLAGILIGMSALMMPQRAHAIDLGWYAGAGLGGAWSGVSASELDSRLAGLGYTTSSVIDDVDFGWKVFGGYQFHEYFALEAIYVDLGEVSSTISPIVPVGSPAQFVADAATVHPYSVNGVALAGVLTWPVNDNIMVFGKFGGFRWDADVKVWCSTCLGTTTADGWDWMGGAGAEYDFTNDVGVRLEWEHYATDRDDVELFSGSVLYRFK